MRPSTVTRLYVCSTCWNSLVERHIDGSWVVQCAPYGEIHAGFHRMTTATKGRERSVQELIEVKRLYQKTSFARVLGIEPQLSPALTLERGRRALGRDSGGID